MASTNTLQVLVNNYRNLVIKATQVSDGTDGETVTVYDATSSTYAVAAPGGAQVKPGVYSKLIALDYDVQDMKIRLQWDANSPQDIVPLGSAPEDFSWERIGGLTVPSGLAGATGSIKVVSLSPVVNAVYSVILYIRKSVPQS